MRVEPQVFEIPATLATGADRAHYCRNKASELIKEAATKYDEAAKFELFNLAERWLTLAFRYRRQERQERS